MILRRAKRFTVAGMALVPLLFGGCGGGDTADLQTWVDQQLRQQKVRIEPLPEFKPFETFLYGANDLRSPFVPPSGVGSPQQIAQRTANGISPDFNRSREPLEEAENNQKNGGHRSDLSSSGQ